MKKLIYISCLGMALLAFSCKPNLEGTAATAGDADLTSFVAIGNSLTSGYADGALIYSGQQNSFPVMMAGQFAKAGGGAFKVPYLLNSGNGMGLSSAGIIPRRVLGYTTNCLGVTSLGPVLASGPATTPTNVSAGGPYNLIGVPGASSFHVAIGAYSSATQGNPYLSRFVETPGVSSMLSEALRAKPSFYLLWLGNNDILGFATNGGVGAISPNFPNPLGGDLIDPAMVQGALNAVMDSMANRGAKGVVANIVDITSIPFFTTIPYNPINLRQGQADTLNAQYAQLGITNVTWKAGANPMVIEDTTVAHPTFKIRHATAQDYMVLTLPMDSVSCAGWGVLPNKALQDQYVLDAEEVAIVRSYTDQYNIAIEALASSYGVAYADMNKYMKSFKSGLVYNGSELNAQFVSGGAFSLDGIHPNPRGYALVANEFIRVINAQYNATIPSVDVTSYDGIIFPN